MARVKTRVWWVYLLSCADGTLYCGIALDVQRRLAEHNGTRNTKGRGASYTSGRRPVSLIYHEGPHAHAKALRRERAIEKLPRQSKLMLQAPSVTPD